MKNFDFSGYATRSNLKCSDGRIIVPGAFKHNDGQRVPLVWQHQHNSSENILGHAILENRPDGVYAYCFLNDTKSGQNVKSLIAHGDINSLSIYANELQQKGSNVIHGTIREVSVVSVGANPGAVIDNLNFAHGDGSIYTSEDEAIIFTGTELVHSEETGDNMAGQTSETNKKQTVEDVLDSLNDIQKQVVFGVIGELIETLGGGEDAEHSDNGENSMKHNVFDGKNPQSDIYSGFLTHSMFQTILSDAQQCGSFRQSFIAHAQNYGIENIDYLFPDAQTLTNEPTIISRDMTWVGGFLGATHHSPFSRIKSVFADITADDARAKGYIKGAQKTDEVLKLLKRVTNPTTVYKKQKLDRDDIVDITSMDVVMWIKREMRMMLNEELARAVLIGDGRLVDDPDKIDETAIRPIYKDDVLYSHRIAFDSDATNLEMIDAVVAARVHYKGTGTPTLYATPEFITALLLTRDGVNRRLYNTVAELAGALRVADIVEVPVMENVSREEGTTNPVTMNLMAIMVNPYDYNIGADKGGEISMFDDFDIDYNQFKYLLETRCSGALVKPKAAIIFEQPVVEAPAG